MGTRILARLSYANVMATVAAFMALGGVGYAAATIGSGDVVNNSLRSKDVRNNALRGKDIRNKTIQAADVGLNKLTGAQINESTLGQVPDAAKLGGVGPEGYMPAGALVRYSFTLGGGETREVVSHGPLKLMARCIDNGTDQGGVANQDAARLFVTTTADGSVLSGIDSLDGGPLATDFVTPATTETDAIWSENSAPDGTIDAIDGGDDDTAVASAPDGATITGSWDQGVHGVNVFGAACAFRGYVITQ